MNVFLAVFKGAYRKNFAYRASTLFYYVGSVISVLAQIALWSFLYRDDADSTNYMVAYVVVVRVLSCLHNRNIASDIEARVRSGDLAIDLIRPVKTSTVFWGEASGNIAAHFVLSGLPILLIFGYAFFKVSVRLGGVLLFIPAALLGSVLYSALYMIIGYIAFIVVMNWPYIRIANDTLRFLSGSVVPIALFPPLLQKLSWFFPFRLLYAFPVDLLLGNITGQDIATGFLLLSAWTLALIAALRLVEAAVEKRLVIQGG